MCRYIHTYIQKHSHIQIHIHIHTYNTYIYIYGERCIHTYTYIHIHTYTYLHIYMHTYIHTHIHAYAHLYIYIYMCVCTYIGGWGVRSQWNGDPPLGNRFRFRVRVVRACGRGEAAREPPDCKPEVGPKVRFPSRGCPRCPVFVPRCPGNVARGVPPVSREMWPAVSRLCPGDDLAWSGGAPRVVPWLSWLVSHC